MAYMNTLERRPALCHRCPELASNLMQPAPATDNIPAEVLDRVLDVVLAIEQRLTRLEARP